MSEHLKYAHHPRYGNTPNFTGLNPDPIDPDVELHWNSTTLEENHSKYKAAGGEDSPFLDAMADSYTQLRRRGAYRDEKRIQNTAILADPSKYVGDPIYADFTHYFDLQSRCRACKSLFLFYAEEQKYWYEVLQFPLEARAVCCVRCRKEKQRASWPAKRYKALSHTKPRSLVEDLEMSQCALELVERRLGATKLLNRVRTLLNRVRNKASEPELIAQVGELSVRVASLAKK